MMKLMMHIRQVLLWNRGAKSGQVLKGKGEGPNIGLVEEDLAIEGVPGTKEWAPKKKAVSAGLLVAAICTAGAAWRGSSVGLLGEMSQPHVQDLVEAHTGGDGVSVGAEGGGSARYGGIVGGPGSKVVASIDDAQITDTGLFSGAVQVKGGNFKVRMEGYGDAEDARPISGEDGFGSTGIVKGRRLGGGTVYILKPGAKNSFSNYNLKFARGFAEPLPISKALMKSDAKQNSRGMGATSKLQDQSGEYNEGAVGDHLLAGRLPSFVPRKFASAPLIHRGLKSEGGRGAKKEEMEGTHSTTKGGEINNGNRMAGGGPRAHIDRSLLHLTDINRQGPNTIRQLQGMFSNDEVCTGMDMPVSIDIFANDDLTGDWLISDVHICDENRIPITDTLPSGATITREDNAITYTPLTGFVGQDTFIYAGQYIFPCSSPEFAFVHIKVVPINPDDQVHTHIDTSFDINTLEKICASEEDITVDIVTQPLRGTATVSDYVITYDPNTGIDGLDKFTYNLCAATNVGHICYSDVLVEVYIANPLSAESDFAWATTDEAVEINVLSNDDFVTTDDCFDFLLDLEREPDNGSAGVAGNVPGGPMFGVVRYTPDQDFFSGDDSFEYKICDKCVNFDPDDPICKVGAVNLHVCRLKANDDYVTVIKDTTIEIDVLANDVCWEVDSETFYVLPFQLPSNGNIVWKEDKKVYSYVPHEEFIGTDSFGYVLINDYSPSGSPAEVHVNVVESILKDDEVCTLVDTRVNIDLTKNDHLSESDEAVCIDSAINLHGTINLLEDNTIDYTPPAGWTGMDMLTYSLATFSDDTQLCNEWEIYPPANVEISVTPPMPTSSQDMSKQVHTNKGTPFHIDACKKKCVSPGEAAVTGTAKIIEQPHRGSVTVSSECIITYAPNEGTEGKDSFTYELCIGTSVGLLCYSDIHVEIYIANPLSAVSDSAETYTGEPVDIDLLRNDEYANVDDCFHFDPIDGLAFVRGPEHGILREGSDTAFGHVQYVPDQEFSCGQDSFEYMICDNCINFDPYDDVCEVGTVDVLVHQYLEALDDSITIVKDKTVEIDVLDNDSYCWESSFEVWMEGATSGNDGSVTWLDDSKKFSYTPQEGFHGIDSFEYSILNNFEDARAYVSIKVIEPPVAEDDTVTMAQAGVSVTINVLDNDTIAAGVPHSLSIHTFPLSGGFVRVEPNNMITYTPPSRSKTGNDEFHYTVCPKVDNAFSREDCSQAQVKISWPTLLRADRSSVVLDLTDMTDVTSITINENPTSGFASVDDENQQISYTPEDGFHGKVSFQVKVCDSFNACQMIPVNLMVVSNDPSSGFVTAFGQFKSPAGSFMADLSAVGKAKFESSIKYKKGATKPSGKTKFRAFGMTFQSTSYDWFMVTSDKDKAEYMGSGTINGEGNYGFRVKIQGNAGPAERGSFRIRITCEQGEQEGWTTIYDNNMGVNDDEDYSGTNITAGSIKIRSNE